MKALREAARICTDIEVKEAEAALSKAAGEPQPIEAEADGDER